MPNGMDTVQIKQERKTVAKDITGKSFGRLKALYPTSIRDAKGYVVWHCRCTCGKEVDVAYNVLLYSNIRSCGCQKQEKNKKLHTHLTHVGGTSVDMLKSTKIPKNNSTGVKGVYLIRGKYVAKIVFQKKQYVLGSFDCLRDAAAARKHGEEFLRNEVLSYYEKWQKRATAELQWAKETPMKINVTKTGSDFNIEISPYLEE